MSESNQIPTEDMRSAYRGFDGHPPLHDWAVSQLVQAASFKPDSAAHAVHVEAAKTYAVLSLRDAVLEATATVKAVATAEIAAAEELSATMKKAANVIYTEVRKATVKSAPEPQKQDAGAA